MLRDFREGAFDFLAIKIRHGIDAEGKKQDENPKEPGRICHLKIPRCLAGMDVGYMGKDVLQTDTIGGNHAGRE